MSSGELSFESSRSLRVTWRITHFWEVATGSSFSLESPAFTLADVVYQLRLYQHRFGHIVKIDLLDSEDPDPGRAVLRDVEFLTRLGQISFLRNKAEFFFLRSTIRRENASDPQGTLTVVCSVGQRTTSSAGCPRAGGARPRASPLGTKSGNLSSESTPSLYVTWTIPEFFQMTRDSRHVQDSPAFDLSGRRYRLELIPSGDAVVMRLLNLSDYTPPSRYVSYEVGFRSTAGEEIHIGRDDLSTGRCFCIWRTHLQGQRHQWFPDGRLRVFCYMGSKEPSTVGCAESGGEVRTAGSKAPPPHTKSVGVQTSNEEHDKKECPGVAKLQSDYRRLLLKGFESDACLVVSGKEFPAHKCVLRARSPVFEAMFGHETAEKDTGRVVIDDLEPDRFHDFMEYLYAGRVESFCDENAFGLYAAADKYDLPSLKSECVEYMRRSLSVDNFCDVVTLALRHQEKELLELAVEFFKKNVAAIILTVKWQQFMRENIDTANELFIRLHVPGKESDSALLP